MRKVLLFSFITLIYSCGGVQNGNERQLSEGEKNAIEYVKAKISSNVKVDSITITSTDTLLCADMPEINDSLFELMGKRFGTGKISEKEYRDYLDKIFDALEAIAKSWSLSKVKTPVAKYTIDEIRLDKRWEPYWRTVYTVSVKIDEMGHTYRVLMDSTCKKAVATEDEFRKLVNDKDKVSHDVFDIY